MSEPTAAEIEPIVKSMAPIFAEARAKGMVLTSTYDPGIQFTADELERTMRSGTFCWGPVNWRLVKPRLTQDELYHLARLEGVDAAMKSAWPTVMASSGISDREWAKSKRDQIIAGLPKGKPAEPKAAQ